MQKLIRISLFLLAVHTAAAECRTATKECAERIALGAEGKYSLVYRSFPLRQVNPAITRAMIVIHGAGRNADDYYRTGLAAAYLAGALEDTLVISPRFAGNTGTGCKDPLSDGEIAWDCGDWKDGLEALNTKGVYSYDLLDEILRLLNDEKNFPNLKRIVLSGHSAGGQITNRYSATNLVHEKLRVAPHYVVSNPSSYVYLDNLRLPRDFHCDTAGKCVEPFRAFGDRRNCTTYNNWMHGLDNLKGYVRNLTPEKIREQLIHRPVTYLMSELDTLPIAGFDSSCISMAQGPTRFDRAKGYFAHVKLHQAKDHAFVPVPLCGHNARCVWTSEPALKVLFPQP
jgi:pimeloyl-ACP methyl ester carboxylesterase